MIFNHFNHQSFFFSKEKDTSMHLVTIVKNLECKILNPVRNLHKPN